MTSSVVCATVGAVSGKDSAHVSGGPSGQSDTHPSESVEVTSLSGVAACRQRIVALIADCDGDRCFDAEVVVSELVTNALEHGQVDVVHVEAQRRPGHLDLVVASPDQGASGTFHPDPDLPDPHDARGRGLVIVRALADSYLVRVQAGIRYDEVVMSLGG